MERIPLDTAAYKIVEDIQYYSKLGGLKKERERLQQQIFMSNMIMTTRQQTLVSLMRLQALGVTDMEIENMAHLMDFGTTSNYEEYKRLYPEIQNEYFIQKPIRIKELTNTIESILKN
jgi:hypothetical protein